MSRGIRLLLWAVCLAGASTFTVTAWRLIDSPLRSDEVDFADQADGILRHGVPKVLWGETGHIPSPIERQQDSDTHFGMWHPPLYLYSLASFRGTFGRANWAARAAGLAWFVLTAAVIWWTTASRRPPQCRVFGVLSISIALLSPLAAQGIFFLDIDNSSLAAALILFAAVFTSTPDDHSLRRTMALAALLLVALWSKLTTPVISLIAMGAYYVLNRDWRGASQAVAVGVLAAAGFALTYLLYCRVANYPSDFMFQTTYVGKSGAYLSPASLVNRLHAIWWTVIWFSPALSLLLLTATVDRVQQYVRRHRLEPLDFWVLFSWACFGAYAVWGGVMGKYTFPAAVAAAVALGLWFPLQLRGVQVVKPRLLLAAVVALFVFQVTLVPALEVKTPAIQAASMTLRAALTHPRNLALALTLGGVAAFVGVAVTSLGGATRLARLAVLLLACAAVGNTVDGFKVMLSADDRSPYRPLREQGFEALVETLNQRLGDADILIAPKDVGFYFHGRSYRLDAVRDLDGAAAIGPLVRRAGITHAADATLHPVLAGAGSVFRGAGLTDVERVKDYAIYGLTK